MGEIRDAMKLHLPLLQSISLRGGPPRRQAERLKKTTGTFSGLLLVTLLWQATPVLAGELETYPDVGPTPELALKDLGIDYIDFC